MQKIYDVKKRARLLHKEYGWNKDEARKIWCFGCPPDALPNVVVDRCKGAQYMTEIKEHVVGGFRGFTKKGALCGSVVRGFRANIEDVKLHQDNVHRGASQIIRCAERVFSACQLASSPTLWEPIYKAEITCPTANLNGVYQTLRNRGGEIVDQIPKKGGVTFITANLPVGNSFGFTEELRKETSGKAFPQLKFDHWDIVPGGSPMEEGSAANKVMLKVRKRKGLKVEAPVFADFYDRI